MNGRSLRDRAVFVRAAGTTSTGASGRSAAIRAARGPASCVQETQSAAEEDGGEVVDVAFEACALDEQRGRIRVDARRGGPGHEPEPDRRRARAEPALERDAVHEPEAAASQRGEDREHSEREMRRVMRQLPGAFAADLDLELVGVLDLQLVPELERRPGRIESRAEVRRRRRCKGTNHPIASSTASSVASTV